MSRRREMRTRAALFRFCKLFLTTAATAITVMAAAHAANVNVSVENGRLTADLGNAVAIADVLSAVAEQTGATLSVHGALGNVRPQAFSEVPLAEALPRLAQPNGLILEFNRLPGGERQLIAIRAVAPGTGSGEERYLSRYSNPRQRAHPGMWDYNKGDAPLPPPEERISRLAKIAQSRGEAAAAAVIYVLVADPDNAVRRSAIGLLTGMRNPDARQALMQAAADAEPEVRTDALKALANDPVDKPVALLAQAAKGDGDAAVRVTALQLLSASKDGDMARAVLEGALNDPDPQIREAAQTALRR